MANADAVVVAATSVVINLNASGQAEAILASLPYRVVVTDIVAGELDEDRRSGRQDADLLAALVRDGGVRVVSLNEADLDVFGTLVTGPAAETPDDGEASTIAYAVEHGIAPVIDERKGLNICRTRFPALKPKTTVDLFADPAVTEALGRDTVAGAVFLALRDARIRMAVEHLAWVIDQIGPDRATLCPSLPRGARRK